MTFFPDEMSWAGSGKKFKRKSMVLGPVLAYFSHTNQGQGAFICIGKKAKTGPKTMNFRFKKFSDPVQVISSGKSVIFA